MDDVAVLPPITRHALQEPVRRLLDSSTAEILSWEVVMIHPGTRGMHGGVYQVSGLAREQTSVHPWSLVLKILCPPNAHDPSAFSEFHTHDPATEPSSLLYWKREALLFQSSFLGDLPPLVAAPRCYGIEDVSAHEVWLWFEYIVDATGPEWQKADYCLAAEALGVFGGAYLAGRPVPSAPWLASRFLRRFATRAAPAVERLPSLRGHRVISRLFPSSVATGLAHIWEQRDALSDALDRLPQTFCHYDAHRGNVLVRSAPTGYQLVLLDWATAGSGPVGADGGMLIGVATQRTFFDVVEREDLDASIFSHYLQGLRRAGWLGDEHLVRFGYTATIALRILLGYMPDELRVWLDESWYAAYEEQTGMRIDDFADRVADPLGWLVERAEEAVALLPRTQRYLPS
jgi:hypothetical protein